MDNNENKQDNIDNNLQNFDADLEEEIANLQKAILLLREERKQIDNETEIINKRINFLKNKEIKIRIQCKKEIDQIHKVVEIKKRKLEDQIEVEQKMIKNSKMNKKNIYNKEKK